MHTTYAYIQIEKEKNTFSLPNGQGGEGRPSGKWPKRQVVAG